MRTAADPISNQGGGGGGYSSGGGGGVDLPEYGSDFEDGYYRTFDPDDSEEEFYVTSSVFNSNPYHR